MFIKYRIINKDNQLLSGILDTNFLIHMFLQDGQSLYFHLGNDGYFKIEFKDLKDCLIAYECFINAIKDNKECNFNHISISIF